MAAELSTTFTRVSSSPFRMRESRGVSATMAETHTGVSAGAWAMAYRLVRSS